MTNNVVVNVTANNNTQGGLNSAQGSVSSFSDKVGGMMTMGGAAAGGLFAAGLSSAMDISSAQTSLETQFGLTGQAAERAGDIAGDVFKAGFGESIGDVTNAIGSVQTSIGDLGSFTDTEIKKMSESALGLSKTFGVDVNEATSAVGQMIKTGLVKDANEGFDLVTKTMQQVPAHLRDDILPTLQEYGTQFRKVGLDGETAMGLISQGLKAGARDADIVADSIKEFSIRAIDGSESTGEGFKALGLDADKMASMVAKGGKDGAKGLDMTLDALRKVKDPVEQAQIATKLFGTQAEDMGDALYALDPSAAAAATGMDKAKGAAEGMTDKMEASPAQQLDSAMRTLQQGIGELLLPVIEKLGGFLKDHKGLIEVLAPVLLGLAAAFSIAAVAIWAVNTAFFANPITWIVLGIVALIAVIVLMIAHWDEVKKTLIQVWDAIVEAVGAAWDWLKENVFSPIGDFFTKKIPGWAKSLWKKIGEVWDSIKEKTAEVWQGIKDAIKGAWKKIKEWVGEALGWLKKMFLNWTGPGLLIKHWDKIKEGVRKAVGKVKEYWDGFISFFKKLPGRVASAASGMFNGIKDAFRSAINWVIRKWNNFSFTIGGGSVLGVDIPKVTLGTPNIPLLATGGLVSGGRGNQVIVGEYGPEMVKLPSGSHVSTASRTQQLLQGATAARDIHVTLMIGDKELGELVIDPIRGAVRRRGGNVQAVIGR